MDSALPPNLQQIEHIAAIEETARHLLTDTEAEKCLVYLIDTVAESALPFLAEQFDVLGYKGWKLATTDRDRRDIIKSAITLKKYMGTVWAIEQAMVSTGYGGATLVEGVPDPVTPDPTKDWANFTIVVDLGNTGGLLDDTPTELANLVNRYKPARCKLIGISFTISISEMLPNINDVIDMEFHSDIQESHDFPVFKYDGTYQYNGVRQYRDQTEALNYQII